MKNLIEIAQEKGAFGEVHDLSNGWYCYIWQKAIDDGLIKDGDFVYAHPQQIPSEVKAYIEQLEMLTKDYTKWLSKSSSAPAITPQLLAETTLKAKPDFLKD